MFANRISYWLNAKGPSHSIDAACCSSTVALEQAYQAITRGECEAAIVGGANLCLHPQSSVQYGRIMKMSRDGKTKSFDLEASGCAKSEAINVLFLQKAKDALRIYADVVNVQCEFIKIPNGETGPQYGFYRDPEDTARFLKRFYDRAGVSPSVVEYVEGFGSAVPEADKSELEAFDKIFCKNRDEPLMVLLGYHRGELAGNLNCETPRNDVPAIKEGRIQVLNEHQQFRRTYAAVNSLSVTGVNAHVLLHGHYKPKNLNRYKSNIPHLVTISGRQESSVKRALDELKSRPIDPEQLALLQNIHQTRITGHLGRGFAILDTKDGMTVSLSEQVDYFDDVQRPLWFVYSGMGSQWPGHSVGELGCAYADGCLTAEEMILSAYSRGLIKKMCPPEIEIACHNSADSCTISGPADAMKTFVGELVAKGIFAKEVPCSNIAYHSSYIAKAGPGLLKYLKEVIKTPKARSDKWVSTSVPQDRWEEEAAKFSSADNAVLVEIAPHGLLQAILKRSLPESCTNIPLTRRGYPDSCHMILEAVGKLYMEGYSPKVHVLYPEVEFPVSTGTPLLSYLVDWAHNEKWSLPQYVSADRMVAASCKFVVSLHDDEHSYLKGHVIRRKTLLPFSYALVAAWDTLAMTLGVPKKQLNVVFSDVHFNAQPVLHDQQSIKLVVSLHRGNGRFEIMDDNYKVATGFISSDYRPIIQLDVQNTTKNERLNSRDVYQLFYEREYEYSGKFRSILSIDDKLSDAKILWNGNWVTFIDGILQLNALKHPHISVSEPSQIRRMAIDVKEHLKHITSKNDVTVIRAQVSDVNDLTICGGVLIKNMKFRDLPPLNEKQVILKTLRFVPRFHSNIDDVWGGEYYLPLNENLENSSEIILRSGVIGNLQSLKWVQAPAPTKAGVSVKVHYAGIHMNDVLRASGVIPMKHEDSEFGMEFSGVLNIQRKIFSVLIHGGAGALGQAMISVSLAKGYRVFTTVSDLQKKKFLHRIFPKLKEEDIGNSRDASFGDMVLKATGGIGCDIVVCSLKGELKNVSLKCSARLGQTYDTVQIHNREIFNFGLHFLTKARIYGLVDISSIFFKPKAGERKRLQTLMSEGIASGAVRPLSRVTFALHEVSRAFNLLAASRHRGRVLLRFQDQHPPAQRRLACCEDGCHIIFCDEQPLGLQLADMLINSGAKKIHLHFTHQPSHLRYKQRNFLMFSNGDDSGQFISIKRAKDGLPATVINLSMLETYEDEEGLTWYRGIKEAAERALLSYHPVILTQLKHRPKKSLVQQIAVLTDITICEEVNSKTTLEDVGIQIEKSQVISSFLRNVHNISIDEADIPSLSLESIKQIEDRITDTKFENVKGLGTFFAYVDPDELLATTEMVFLPTLTNNSTMIVLKWAGVKKSFYLLGCETGVFVAMELATILEQHGQIGTVFCIGDGPEETKSLIKEQLSEYKNEEMLQIGLVQHMFTLMTGESAVSLENIEGVTWRQRVDICVRTLLGHVPHSAQYARSLIEAAYARIAITISYNTNPKALKSNIVVLRALSPYSTSTIPCTLQRYSQQPISIYNLTTPLAHVARDMRCASIINKHLSKEILKAFDKKNICESYLLNADTFMTTAEK
ncbi:Uncharacterized protein OBRU01_13331, partial [Operophtera brumata]